MTLLKLELRKNLLAATSLAAAFAVTVLAAPLAASAGGVELRPAFAALFTLWRFLGAPLAALLLGAAAGAQLDAPGEPALPVSPGRRFAAAAGAALLLFAGLIVPLFLFLQTGPAGVEAAFHPTLSFIAAQTLLWSGFLLCAFAMAALLGHGVAGGLAGLALQAATLLPIGIVGPHMEFDEVPSGRLLASLVLLTVAGALGAGWSGFRRRSRGVGGRRDLALAAALALAGPLASWLYFGRSVHYVLFVMPGEPRHTE